MLKMMNLQNSSLVDPDERIKQAKMTIHDRADLQFARLNTPITNRCEQEPSQRTGDMENANLYISKGNEMKESVGK